MPVNASLPRGVLDGILVVDFTQAIAGPFATRVLAEMGARVIKIESPRGDLVRGVQCRPERGWGAMFGHGSAGKESVAVDMSKPEGHRIVDRLLDLADVVVENFRPGTLERWGFDPAKLVDRPKHPVVCSVSGFGRGNECSGWSATDPMGQAFGGMTYMIGEPGEPPYLTSNGIADTSTAMTAATAILGALLGRQRDGKGRHLDIAMADVMLAMDCVTNPVAAAFEDAQFQPLGHNHPAVCPFGIFEAADGYVVIQGMGQGPDSTWGRLCATIDEPALITDPRTASEAARLQNRAVVNDAVARWVGERPRKTVVDRIQAAGGLCGPVLSPREAVEHPVARSRGTVPNVEGHGSYRAVALPFKVSGLTGDPQRPPKLGEHNAAVLGELLGMAADDVARLQSEGVLRASDRWP